MTANELPGQLVPLIGRERELAFLAYVDCGRGSLPVQGITCARPPDRRAFGGHPDKVGSVILNSSAALTSDQSIRQRIEARGLLGRWPMGRLASLGLDSIQILLYYVDRSKLTLLGLVAHKAGCIDLRVSVCQKQKMSHKGVRAFLKVTMGTDSRDLYCMVP
jgi:hypothetical protein